jgi:hypothetical protein
MFRKRAWTADTNKVNWCVSAFFSFMRKWLSDVIVFSSRESRGISRNFVCVRRRFGDCHLVPVHSCISTGAGPWKFQQKIRLYTLELYSSLSENFNKKLLGMWMIHLFTHERPTPFLRYDSSIWGLEAALSPEKLVTIRETIRYRNPEDHSLKRIYV